MTGFVRVFANGWRMPSTADELAAASRTDFLRAAGSRRWGLLLSNFAAMAISTMMMTLDPV